jgi:cyclopropane fatty-acyl-phospholipid synthase-like methyltransferase
VSERPSQDEVFRRGEADAWFRRNRAALEAFDPNRDPITRAVAQAELQPRRILEYGCSLGRRLSWLTDHYGASGVGIEPSDEALREARARDQRVAWLQGTMDDHPPLPGGRVDLVVCSFVLHWVDRRRLLSSLSNLDAQVEDGGFVVISDFFPDHAQRREYHHLPGQGVYTYKADYPAMLLATGVYRLRFWQTLSYADLQPRIIGAGDRAQVAVLERWPDDDAA